MANDLNLINFEIGLNLDEPIEKDDQVLNELDLKLRDLYPTSTRVPELNGIILISKPRKSRLTITQRQINLTIEPVEPGSSCDEVIKGLIQEWNIIKNIVQLKGKANSIITGIFIYNQEKSFDITKILKWQIESARILGKGDINVGAMISVDNLSSSNLVSIIGDVTTGKFRNIQYSKKSKIELHKFEQQLEIYCEEVKTKLVKLLNKNFFE